MKQFFDPRGIGWFIAGGVLLAFLVEEGISEEGLIALIIAVACLIPFYLKNREALDAALAGVRYDEVYDEEPAEEDFDQEEVVEEYTPQENAPADTPAENEALDETAEDIEFEFEPSSGQ